MSLQASNSSPVVKEASFIALNQKAANIHLKRAAFSCLLFILFLSEYSNSWIGNLFAYDTRNVIQQATIVLCFIFIYFTLVDGIRAVKKRPSSFIMSPEQRKLMGLVPYSTKEYREASNLERHKKVMDQTSPQTPFNDFKILPSGEHISPSNKLAQQMNTSIISNNSFNNSGLNGSFYSQSMNKSLSSFDGSFLESSGNVSFLRHRSLHKSSPRTPEDFMTDQKKLTAYLQNYEKENSKNYSNEKSFNTSLNLSYNNQDYSQELAENFYQLSYLSPKSPERAKENKDDSARIAVEKYWNSNNITSGKLNQMVARLRHYLSISVLKRFSDKIDTINLQLTKNGNKEQIGESSLDQLKLVQIMQQDPFFTWILTLLDLSSNQKHVVQRIKDLASGYMSDFKWNPSTDGVASKDKTSQLSDDCSIVMHAFCVFIDFQTPLDPRCPNGKSFSTTYYRDISSLTPEEKNKSKFSSKVYIQKSKSDPSHYQVMNNGKLYDPLGGRHNMMHSIILFLYMVNNEHRAMLGQVSLCNKGLNLLHVIEV